MSNGQNKMQEKILLGFKDCHKFVYVTPLITGNYIGQYFSGQKAMVTMDDTTNRFYKKRRAGSSASETHVTSGQTLGHHRAKDNAFAPGILNCQNDVKTQR